MLAKIKSWQSFIKLCLETKTAQQLSDIFDLFLTHAEQEDIAARYEIIRELLLNQITQREIANKLDISIAKITRGSNALRCINSNTKNLLKAKLQ